MKQFCKKAPSARNFKLQVGHNNEIMADTLGII